MFCEARYLTYCRTVPAAYKDR